MERTNSDVSTSYIIKAKVSSQSSIGKKVLRQKSFDKDKPCAEISFKDFLDFVRTAYQVNDSLEGTVNDSNVQKYLDWQEVAKNELVTTLLEKEDNVERPRNEPTSSDCDKATITQPQDTGEEQTPSETRLPVTKKSKSLTNACFPEAKPVEPNHCVEHVLKRKLSELIQEGLLDSVLPYVVPKTPLVPSQSTRKEPQPSDVKRISDKNPPHGVGLSVSTSKDRVAVSRRKVSTGEPEVEIHVCDEVKNMKRDFRCPQTLLVSKMGYFAQVTTGQKLEDMDISVHCDIAIFDWLMRWVKRGSEEGPVLDSSNVVPILVSAAFLQMDPLLEDCLKFCHRHMGAVVQSSTTLACLNDSLLVRLANMFSNSEVEALKDRRDKISSRLYCKLIQSLAEPTPDPARGHFATLSTLYRCGQCGKLVVSRLVAQVPCSPSHMQVSPSGMLSSAHARDPHWNLSEYIRGLWTELQCWRLVYWHLWGDCHFLYCSACDTHYPLREGLWCCYHPEEPQYFTKEAHRMLTFPIGRYPCCGERSYRFQPVPQRSGCQFREHQPEMISERDRLVKVLYVQHQRLIAAEPPELQFPHRVSKLVSSRETGKEEEPPWWDGMEIVPPRPHVGILAKWEQQKSQKVRDRSTTAYDCSSNVGTTRPTTAAAVRMLNRRLSDHAASETAGSSSSEDGSEDTEESESEGSDDSGPSHQRWDSDRCSATPPTRARRRFRYRRGEGTRGWELKQSTRANQDNQRDVEETQTRHMANFLARRTYADAGGRRGHWGNGGTYSKVDHDRKDGNHSTSHGYERQHSQSRYKISR